MARGAYRGKVNTAGELGFLSRQKAMIVERLAEIDSRPQATETLLQWIKEEVFNLKLRLEQWAGE
ncbi:MAG TPA: hypothetical protein VG407_04780 [Caulobacteraceae bacterium]|jgi:hypothetical protein|nr:hypothetical protein [Caulobacteraceae bacterium]